MTPETWCKVSGARFNIAETEIIPIGTQEHRSFMVRERTNHRENRKIPDSIHIAIDGELVRSLGAWVGNLTDQVNIWTKTLDKVQASLDIWKKGHPTMKGKKHVAQMMVGGQTQYMVNVQGTSDTVEKGLIKMVRKFAWDDKRASISLPILY